MMTMALVTGAAGFVGSHVCEALVEKGIRVRAVDCFLEDSYSADIKRRTWQELQSLADLELVEWDLRQPLPKHLLSGVDVVMNEAAMPGLMKSWSDLALYTSCNVNLLGRILEASVIKSPAPFVIQISTSSVYGREANGDEETPPAPISPYGVTKLAAEELLHAYGRTHGVPHCVLRYFSVYGPRQRPDMAYNRIIAAVLTGQPIVIYGDGGQTRSNTYVRDCADATVRAALTQPAWETINIAGGEVASLLEIVSLIEELTGLNATLNFSKERPGDQRHTHGNILKAQDLLGWHPRTTLREGLLAQITWQRRHLLGIEES